MYSTVGGIPPSHRPRSISVAVVQRFHLATLQERASPEVFGASAAKPRIDTAKGVVYEVKVLGLKSRNKRIYTSGAVRAAIPMYEGAVVYIDHPDGESNGRKYRERFGRLKGVYQRPDGSLWARELRYNPEHADAKSFAWNVQNDPHGIGLSHNADGEGYRDANGNIVVDKIREVFSVDIVDTPATTSGMFEQTGCAKLPKLKEEDMNPLADPAAPPDQPPAAAPGAPAPAPDSLDAAAGLSDGLDTGPDASAPMDPNADTMGADVTDTDGDGDIDHKDAIVSAASALVDGLKNGTITKDKAKKYVHQLMDMLDDSPELPTDAADGADVAGNSQEFLAAAAPIAARVAAGAAGSALGSKASGGDDEKMEEALKRLPTRAAKWAAAQIAKSRLRERVQYAREVLGEDAITPVFVGSLLEAKSDKIAVDRINDRAALAKKVAGTQLVDPNKTVVKTPNKTPAKQKVDLYEQVKQDFYS